MITEGSSHSEKHWWEEIDNFPQNPSKIDWDSIDWQRIVNEIVRDAKTGNVRQHRVKLTKLYELAPPESLYKALINLHRGFIFLKTGPASSAEAYLTECIRILRRIEKGPSLELHKGQGFALFSRAFSQQVNKSDSEVLELLEAAYEKLEKAKELDEHKGLLASLDWRAKIYFEKAGDTKRAGDLGDRHKEFAFGTANINQIGNFFTFKDYARMDAPRGLTIMHANLKEAAPYFAGEGDWKSFVDLLAFDGAIQFDEDRYGSYLKLLLSRALFEFFELHHDTEGLGEFFKIAGRFFMPSIVFWNNAYPMLKRGWPGKPALSSENEKRFEFVFHEDGNVIYERWLLVKNVIDEIETTISYEPLRNLLVEIGMADHVVTLRSESTASQPPSLIVGVRPNTLLQIYTKTNIHILHISDIQFGPNNVYKGNDRRKLLEYLSDDISGYKSEGIPLPDIVIVTGDIAESGDYENEYKDAHEFFNGLCAAVREAGNQRFSKDRILIVPGNHDVNWKVCKPILKKDRNNDRWIPKRGKEEEYPQRFNAFKRFFDEFYKDSLKLGYDLQTGITIFPPLEVGSQNIVIVGFNSCERENSRQHYGFIDPSRITSAAEQVESSYKGATKIAVFHHHAFPVINPATQEVDLSLLRNFPLILRELAQNKFKLCLHGHVHLPVGTSYPELSQAYLRYFGESNMPILGAGTIGVVEKFRQGTSDKYPRSYNILTVDISGLRPYLSIRRRIWKIDELGQGKWEADTIEGKLVKSMPLPY